MELFAFDDAYLRRLREGDRETEEHFERYFREFLDRTIAREVRPDAVADVRQQVLIIVLTKLRLGEPRDGRKFGAYVYGICRRVLREFHRGERRHDRTDVPLLPPEPAPVIDEIISRETQEAVNSTLAAMPKRDADILRALWIDELDKDEVCRRHGIDRDYLRVLVLRARQRFRKEFKPL